VILGQRRFQLVIAVPTHPIPSLGCCRLFRTPLPDPAGRTSAARVISGHLCLREFQNGRCHPANRWIVDPMGDLCGWIWCAIAGLFRSRAALLSEILVLRHQLTVLHRRSPKRVAGGNLDRLIFVGSSPGRVGKAAIARADSPNCSQLVACAGRSVPKPDTMGFFEGPARIDQREPDKVGMLDVTLTQLVASWFVWGATQIGQREDDSQRVPHPVPRLGCPLNPTIAAAPSSIGLPLNSNLSSVSILLVSRKLSSRSVLIQIS
jgi:hypothetical protein